VPGVPHLFTVSPNRIPRRGDSTPDKARRRASVEGFADAATRHILLWTDVRERDCAEDWTAR